MRAWIEYCMETILLLLLLLPRTACCFTAVRSVLRV